MKKIYYTFILFCASNLLFAQNYAIQFCEAQTEKSAMDFARKNQLKAAAFLPYENTLLVTGNVPSNESICFVSEWKIMVPHFAFAKNEIIVRVLENRVNDFINFMQQNNLEKVYPHAFIPNQFTIKNVRNNEADLIEFNSVLKSKSFVKVAQINYVHTLQAASVNDPLFERQWSIKNTGSVLQGNGTLGADMNVDSAWTVTTGNNIKIAILDSGVDTLHEDLVANILSGFDGFANDSVDTKGYPTPNFSSDGHGTACAGIAAAVGDNNIGVAGVAYSSKIVPIRIFYYQDYGGNIGVQPTTSTDALVSGSAYAWRVANSDVMSTSAGLNPIFIFFLGIDTEIVDDEINDAFNNGRAGKGVPMFFSAGNDDIDDVLWPAYLSNTIAVGASSMCDERKSPDDCSSETWGSTFGTHLDFVAPGTLIASTDITGSLGYSANNYTFSFNGTSAACPNAAGVGALVLSVKPNLHARDVKSILNLTAVKVPDYDYNETLEHGTWNEEVGYGRIDAYKAVVLAQNYESTVSILEVDRKTEILMYPNPANVMVRFATDPGLNANAVIFSADGRKVLDFTIVSNQEIPLQLNAGIYFVQIADETGVVLDVKKLIVL
jgi:subtilisin family serine protease